MTLGDLQELVYPWARKNFGDVPSWMPLLGIGEELGELNHAHLKQEQGIRGTTGEHTEAIKDAIGDMLIFLAHYACIRGFDLDEIMEETWQTVKKRDWVKDPVKGGVDGQGTAPGESI